MFANLPFASVYMNRDDCSLFLFVRVNGPKENKSIYAATATTVDELTKYMNRHIVLRTMFPNKDYTYVELQDGHFIKTDYSDKIATSERLKRAGRFEPELCHNKIEIECFLNSL